MINSSCIELYDTCRNILKEALTRPKFSDPVKVCPIYNDHKHGSCAHVDGFLCDRNSCTAAAQKLVRESLPSTPFIAKVGVTKETKALALALARDISEMYAAAVLDKKFNPSIGTPGVNKNLIKLLKVVNGPEVIISKLVDIRMTMSADEKSITFCFTSYDTSNETVVSRAFTITVINDE